MVTRPGTDDELARQHDDFSNQIGELLIEAQDLAYGRGAENRAEENAALDAENEILRTRLEICATAMRDAARYFQSDSRQAIVLRGAIAQAENLPVPTAAALQTITLRVDSGCVLAPQSLPAGIALEVVDGDAGDTWRYGTIDGRIVAEQFPSATEPGDPALVVFVLASAA